MTDVDERAPVSIATRERSAEEADLLARWTAPHADDDVPAHLALVSDLTADTPLPGQGRTLLLWEVLASLGATGLQRARAAEPHLDAAAILAEAGRSPSPGASYGVFASESPGTTLTASRARDGSWRLDGDKAWCSLGRTLSHGLVTAWIDAPDDDEQQRGLFVVALDDRGVSAVLEPWEPRGLVAIRSTGLRFTGVQADPVGAPGWYLRRDGFAYGGMGVAAIWFGAATRLARRLRRPSGRAPDQVARMHLGRADLALHAARAVLGDAARAVDDGEARGQEGAVLAHRVRGVVASAAETVLDVCAHALGPKPLTEADHAGMVADLQLYLRQHHAERDLAALGGLLLPTADEPS